MNKLSLYTNAENSPDVEIAGPIIGIVKFSVLTRNDVGSYISSRENSWDSHVKSIFDIKRLDFRIKLLTEIALRQLELQSISPNKNWFSFVIVISKLLPDRYKKILNQYASQYSWLKILERGIDEWVGVESIVLNELIGLKKYFAHQKQVNFINFRVDDDDFLSIDFLERCNEYIKHENVGKFLSFARGYKILWNDFDVKVLNQEAVIKPLIAIGLASICSFCPSLNKITSNLKTVYAGINHNEIGSAYEVIFDNTESMYVWSLHSSQDTYKRFSAEEFRRLSFTGSLTKLEKFPSLDGFYNY